LFRLNLSLLACVNAHSFARKARGCGQHPAFPAPSDFGAPHRSQDSGESGRENVFARHCEERSDEAIQTFAADAVWIASRSLSSGAHSRDPLARNDNAGRRNWLSRWTGAL